MLKITSIFTLVNSACRAVAYAAVASAALCQRPRVLRSVSLNDCTPRLRRLQPLARKAANFSASAVVGFASRVISASGAIPNVTAAVSRIRWTWDGARGGAAPPPETTLWAGHDGAGIYHERDT